MGNVVKVEIPVTEEAAVLLADPARLQHIGQVVSALLSPPGAQPDPLIALIREFKAEAHANGLTDEMIDEELAAYNSERRS